MRDERTQDGQQDATPDAVPQQAAESKDREAQRGVPRADHNLEENDGNTPAQGERTGDRESTGGGKG